jgi:hypothetical protein
LSSDRNSPAPPVWRWPRDRAQRVEPSGDRRQEAFACLHIGGHRPEERWLRLVGAMGASETLDGVVGAPTGFKQIMLAQSLVSCAKIGVVGTAGAAGVGKDQHAFVVIHERLGLAEIG